MNGWVVDKESHNNMPIYGYMLPNLSPRPNLHKVQSAYNNNVVLTRGTKAMNGSECSISTMHTSLHIVYT